MILVRCSKLTSPQKVADRYERSRLGRLAEETDIPWSELNKLAKNVVGREFSDVRFLGESESKKVRSYLNRNYSVLSERYRRMRWN